jgi:serine/threonine-protein kinase
VICPNCSAGEISPLTHRCELCGFTPQGTVAVQPPQAEAVDDLARQELGERFRLDTFLGRGNATAVYVAREQGSDRQIVVKVFPRLPEGRPERDERFRKAVEAVAGLEHPHIVPVFDHGWTEQLYWYSMEYVNGRSLRNFLLQRGPLDLKACQRVVAQVASALDYAHRRGIVHGCLKPENILIDADGWVHVCDLLVTRTVAASGPAAPAPPVDRIGGGRSPFAAPDDLTSPFSDQYALAVVVAECLTGSAPIDRVGLSPRAALAAQRPDLPLHVTHAVERAMSLKPIDRFPGVLDFVAALETYAITLPDARPSGRRSDTILMVDDWEPPANPLSRRSLIGGAVLLALIAVLAGTFGPAALQRVRRAVAPDRSASPGSPATDTAGAVTSPAGSPAGSTLVAPARSAARPAAGAAPGASRRPSPARERARPAPAPRPVGEGRLFVNASPWGQLYVDGQLIGNTPRANLALPAGAHAIRVLREGYEPFERTVQVDAGQTVRLTDITLVPRP